MKRIFSIFCVCALLLSLSGCGLLDYLYHKEVPINKMEKPVAEVQTDATVQEVEVTEPAGPDLPYPLEFYFSSGAGGWGTSLTLQADGSFTGSFHDSEMGDASADYPNGTVYICNFEGKFSTPVQVDEYTYSPELQDYIDFEEYGKDVCRDKNGEYVDNYGFVGLDCDMRLSDILDCNEQGMGEMSL